MNRTAIIKRIAAGMLAAVLTAALAGCGKTPASSAGGQDTFEPDSAVSTTGAWREEDVTPDENARSYKTPVALADGSVRMLEAGADNTLHLLTSADNGATWQEITVDWQPAGAESFGVCRMLPDGGCFVTAVKEENGQRKESYWTLDPETGVLDPVTLPENIVQLSDAYPLGGDSLLLLGMSLVPASADAPAVLVDENGMMKTTSPWKLDLATGACEELTALTNTLQGSIISGMAADPTELGAYYSLAYMDTGVQLLRTDADEATACVFDSLPNASAAAFAACADAEGNYYYASAKGIYRVAKGGDLAELVVDGASTALSRSEAVVMGLTCCADGSFLTVSLEGGQDAMTAHLYRYYWDADAPAEENTAALTVWSLENNDTVRAAIEVYEQQNPGLTVTYQVAMEDGATTREDALSALNTALLAGSGPDVLILDGLDWQAYRDKGLLADLSEWVDLSALQSNLVDPFREQEGVFVLPARFSVPVLCGAPEDLAGLDSLDALAEYLLQLPARPAWDYTSAGYYEQLEQPYGLGFVSVEQLLDFVLGSSAAALTEDGVNGDAVEAVLKFVQQVGRYYGMEDYKGLLSNGVISGGSEGQSVSYGDGSYECFSTGNALLAWEEMLTPSYLTAVRKDRAGVSLIQRPGLVQGAYTPRTLAAVCAGASEEAGAFIAILFGSEVQASWQQDGMPVRADALQSSIKANCPDPEARQNVQALIDALQTPVTQPDDTVRDALLQNANALIAGDVTLEQARTGVEDALNLYLAEQE